jgi:aspartate aminotransferase
VVDLLNKIPGVDCMATDGTFYELPNVKQAISAMGLKDDLALSEYFIEGGVALVPGSAFGCPGHIRISIATSMDNLETALQRIKIMVEKKSV